MTKGTISSCLDCSLWYRFLKKLAFSSLCLNFCVCNCHWKKKSWIGTKPPMWLHNIGREIQTDGLLAVTYFPAATMLLYKFFSPVCCTFCNTKDPVVSIFLNFVDSRSSELHCRKIQFSGFFKVCLSVFLIFHIYVYIFFCWVVESLHLPLSTIDNMLWLKSRCPTLMVPVGSKMSLWFCIANRTPITSISGVFTGGLMARNPASYVSSLTLDMRRTCESGVFTLP